MLRTIDRRGALETLLTLGVAMATGACNGRNDRGAEYPSVPGANPANLPPYRGGYRLPVVGQWKVLRSHYTTNPKSQKSPQLYAVDLIINGALPPKPKRNEDYPSYGEPIVADGPGVIAVVVDGIHDNQPGDINNYDAHGNYMVIDHRNGEFSLFAHLIPGTARMRPGMVVQMGQEIARCGNSGRSSMPHLHWQIMNHPHASVARGLPIRHVPYSKNGRSSTARLLGNDVVEVQ